MRTSESTANIAAALAAAQGAMKPVPLDGTNSHFGSRYATLAALWQTARPVLAAHGLSVLQGRGADGGIETIILHSSGEWIVLDGVPMRPVKDDPQGAASAITYARRYGFAAAVGLVADDDDDGNTASRPASGGSTASSKSAPDPAAHNTPCELSGTMEAAATPREIITKAGAHHQTAEFVLVAPTGKVPVTAWHDAAGVALSGHPGAAVRVVGKWNVYKDKLSINASTVEFAAGPGSDDDIPF